MSNNNVTVETEIPIDLSNTDISRPLFDNVFVNCTTGEVKVEVSEKGLKSLVVPLVFDEPATDTNGKQVQPGFTVTDRILITPTGGLTQQMINERLARFQVAALGLSKPQNFGATDQYISKKVKVGFKTRVDKNDASKVYQDVRSYSKA
jgi:hypothetical protein